MYDDLCTNELVPIYKCNFIILVHINQASGSMIINIRLVIE